MDGLSSFQTDFAVPGLGSGTDLRGLEEEEVVLELRGVVSVGSDMVVLSMNV